MLPQNGSPPSNPSSFSVNKNYEDAIMHPHSFGAGRGIRTPVGLHPNGFQDRLVMTASIFLQTYYIIIIHLKQIVNDFCA